MPRYFVAVPVPDGVKARLLAVQPAALAGMRLVGRDELHLTLHFLGDVPGEQAEAVRKALESVKVNPFTVTVRRLGRFPTEGEPRVVWAGVEADPPLIELHRAVGQALTDAIGFRPEERPYSPHITLARLNDPVLPGSIDRYLEENSDLNIRGVRVDHFALYSSTVEGSAPRYREELLVRLPESASST
jgi:2'-5' RNA ligase